MSNSDANNYFEEMCKAMSMVARAHPRAIFMGQAVVARGTMMSSTMRDVPLDQRLELPVAEDMQLGMAIGASLNGDLPICIYPRLNFLLLAMSQLVLHLDAIPVYSSYRPKVIVRSAIAAHGPLFPGPQHIGDFTEAISLMLRTVHVVKLWRSDQIVNEYRKALDRARSTLLIEVSAAYNA